MFIVGAIRLDELRRQWIFVVTSYFIRSGGCFSVLSDNKLFTNYSIGMREIFAFYRSLPVIIFGFVNTEFGLKLNKSEAIKKYLKNK